MHINSWGRCQKNVQEDQDFCLRLLRFTFATENPPFLGGNVMKIGWIYNSGRYKRRRRGHKEKGKRIRPISFHDTTDTTTGNLRSISHLLFTRWAKLRFIYKKIIHWFSPFSDIVQLSSGSLLYLSMVMKGEVECASSVLGKEVLLF